MVGEFFGAWRAWDGIRALDYLLTRQEVDPANIGITGNSGGGTMTTWLCGLDQRWTMAAPACFVSTFRRNFENELPQDTEQCPPMALALGLDHCDFLAAMAPKPVIILAKEQDFFDVRGAEEAYVRLKKIYRLLGHEQNIALFVGPTDHGFSKENREAMYSWFAAHSQKPKVKASSEKLSGALHAHEEIIAVKEPVLTIEKDETLWCTSGGQVSLDPLSLSVFDFTRQKSTILASRRKPLSKDELGKSIRDVLQIPTIEKEPPDYHVWPYLQNRSYPAKFAIGFAVVTEPRIEAIVYQLSDVRRSSRPVPTKSTATLYVSNVSSDQELRDEPLLQSIVSDNVTDVFTCDVRGTGESQPDTCGKDSFSKPYGSEFFTRSMVLC